MDYFKFDEKVRTVMYCLLWELPPEEHYGFFKKMDDSDFWFKNCPDDKTKYYVQAQKYLRRNKILRIKNKMI